MQIRNTKVNSIYGYISRHKSEDTDWWHMGNGSTDIQILLNTFFSEDWNDLKNEVPNWNDDYIQIMLESIDFGFDGMFAPALEKRSILNAAEFLLDMFIALDNWDYRNHISYSSFFINLSDTKKIKELRFMENWMIDNGFEQELSPKSKSDPLENIREAIEKASR